MTQEEKQLLLTDLCARLPYGVNCHIEDKNGKIIDGIIYDINIDLSDSYYLADFKTSEGFYLLVEFGWFKPYLRSLSNMTEEEEKEYFDKWGVLGTDDFDNYKIVDWLNAHHFDYRGLIPKGLALEAPEGMYNS